MRKTFILLSLLLLGCSCGNPSDALRLVPPVEVKSFTVFNHWIESVLVDAEGRSVCFMDSGAILRVGTDCSDFGESGVIDKDSDQENTIRTALRAYVDGHLPTSQQDSLVADARSGVVLVHKWNPREQQAVSVLLYLEGVFFFSNEASGQERPDG